MTSAQSINRKKVCNTIYFVLLCGLAIAMPTSKAIMNFGWVLLLLNWLVQADFANKFRNFRTQYLLQAFLVLALAYLVSMCWSDDLNYALNDIRKKLPLFILPLVILTSAPLTKPRWQFLQWVYLLTIFVTTIIGLVRFLTIPNLPYREIIPFISHIRFSLNVCLAIALSLSMVLHYKSWPLRLGLLLFCGWLIAFLLLLQSYTGLIILFVMGCVVAIASFKPLWIVTMFVVVLGLGGISSYYIYNYYHLQPIAEQPLQFHTSNGNPYDHACDGFIESGNFVSNYICNQELEQSWAQSSAYPIDSLTATGYPLRGALIRYLNCKGLPKDSLGVSQLNAVDIAAIEQGIANPSYLHQGSLRKLFDVILYEYETMRHHASPCDFTMLERFELWRNGWQIILQHPLFGVGNGDVRHVAHERLMAIDSPIQGTSKTLHNQYLTFLLTFGLVGTLLILFFFIRSWIRHKPLSLLYIAYITIVLVSFINEDTLETLAGIVFVAFWTTLFSKQQKCINITH